MQLASDESPRVRFQVAFSLGEAQGADAVGQEVVAGLAAVGRAMAMICGCAPRFSAPAAPGQNRYCELAQSTGDTVDAALLRQLAFLIGRDDNHDAPTANLLNTLADSAAASNTATLHPILLGLADGLRGAEDFAAKAAADVAAGRRALSSAP